MTNGLGDMYNYGMAVKVEFLPGTSIRDAFAQALKFSITHNVSVQFDFNGKWQWVRPTGTVESLMSKWNAYPEKTLTFDESMILKENSP